MSYSDKRKAEIWLKHIDAFVDMQVQWTIEMGRSPTKVFMHPLTIRILFTYLERGLFRIREIENNNEKWLHSIRVFEDSAVGIYNFRFED